MQRGGSKALFEENKEYRQNSSDALPAFIRLF
jgi:hypothetical protein